jgi:hypothetical protein
MAGNARTARDNTAIERKKVTKRAKKAPKTDPLVQEALQVTWVLKGHLKNAQISYLRVGRMLADVRDRKLYRHLNHPDLESYAEQRLHLARASLYRYLQVYGWVSVNHKEWLAPKPKGFIPDLSDIADLIWIENELAGGNLDPATRKTLEEFRKRALNGDLKQADMEEFRRGQKQGDQGLSAFLAAVRNLRQRGARIESMPPEVISHLDAAIGILENAAVLHKSLSKNLFRSEIGREARRQSLVN